MSLTEVVAAALVLLVGSSSAARLWGQGLRASVDLAQREARLRQLDTLLLASEGEARELAAQLGPASDCQVAAGQLLPLLRALPTELARAGEAPATLTLPPSEPRLLHLRWEAGGLRRERLLSPAALGLCREGSHGT
jgi:hypothetical protein